MLGIKKYTQRMNQAAIQLRFDELFFKVAVITIEHQAMIRKAPEDEKPGIISDWILRRKLAIIETRIRIVDILSPSRYKEINDAFICNSEKIFTIKNKSCRMSGYYLKEKEV